MRHYDKGLIVRTGYLFILCLVVVSTSSCVPFIDHYYFPDGYDTENSQWDCAWSNRSTCKANLSSDIGLVVATLRDFGTIYVDIVVVAKRESIVSVSGGEVSVQPEEGDVTRVDLVTHTWSSDLDKQLYGEHYQTFSFTTDVVDDSPSFVLEIPTILVDENDFDVGPVKMIRKSRLELDTSLLAAPW